MLYPARFLAFAIASSENIFTFRFSVDLPRPLPVTGDMWIFVVDDFFLPLKVIFSFYFCFRYFAGLRRRAVQTWGSVFCLEAASSTHGLVGGIGVSVTFPKLGIYG